jgi:hypothetical protein
MDKTKVTKNDIGTYVIVKRGIPAGTVHSVHDTLESAEKALASEHYGSQDAMIVLLPDHLTETDEYTSNAD